MVSVNESKIFCLYCRGEINQQEIKELNPLQPQQYHQECFEEIIKDNHCEYCSGLLNELNSYYTEDSVKIHQKCLNDLQEKIKEKIKFKVKDLLEELPLKKLAKDYAFYEMNEESLSRYVEKLKGYLKPELAIYSSKSNEFKTLIEKKVKELLQEEITENIKKNLQMKLEQELNNCNLDSKKEIVNKTIQFIWNYYLEIPISYKDRINHKIMTKPSLDSVNCTIFHYKLEKLFNTPLEFNRIVNSNYNDLADYLMSQPLSIQHLSM